ncbi:hypothetical protein MMC25_008118 [Agyrium rufum]|nr:hypothetical protein [Agyrium rufum]
MEVPPNSLSPNIDRGQNLEIASLITASLCVASLVFRLLGRGPIVRNLGIDDLFILIATMSTVVSTVFNVKQVAAGGGRHQYYLSVSQLIESTKYSTFSEVLVLWITALTKISICIFVMRIPNSQRLKNFLLVVIAYLAVVNIVVIVVFLTQCRPIDALWNPIVQTQATCLPKNVELGLS